MIGKSEAISLANQLHESYNKKIAALEEELAVTKNTLQDKIVAKEIVDSNLKRILAAVNKLSAEKKALADANKELQAKVDDLYRYSNR